MSIQKTLNPIFDVSATVKYIASESRPDSNYHLFSYKIKIQNRSHFSAQLMSRHWVITDSHGQTEEVKGAGVVGLQPQISSNQVFEYESLCPLPTSSGTMKGKYQFIADNGEAFEIEIPEFYLVAPSALH